MNKFASQYLTFNEVCRQELQRMGSNITGALPTESLRRTSEHSFNDISIEETEKK